MVTVFIQLASFVTCIIVYTNCNSQTTRDTKEVKHNPIKNYDSTFKTIHILVALCDNKYQGIVPVPASIGNGQNPKTNLYWGAAYGIKNYFNKSKYWSLIEVRKTKGKRLERAIFKHKQKKYYLVADAYDGKFIKQTTTDFLNYSCGNNKDTLQLKERTIGIGGNAQLSAYIGHDGLMDFELDILFENEDKRKREVIILACYSQHFFSAHLKQANVRPLLWTTGLMSPEAYTIHDALQAYINNGDNEMIQLRAAQTYSKYQKCGLAAAKRLLQSDW